MNDKIITGEVINILQNWRIIINRGKKDGVEPGQKYQVYRIGEMLTDPKTGESLGALESICGYGTVEQVQPKKATLTLEPLPAKVDTNCYVRRIALYSPRALYPHSPLYNNIDNDTLYG